MQTWDTILAERERAMREQVQREQVLLAQAEAVAYLAFRRRCRDDRRAALHCGCADCKRRWEATSAWAETMLTEARALQA